MNDSNTAVNDLLFISHRMPWPPNKGEKIRAWHFLEHLARSWRVHLGVVVDDPSDMPHVARLRETCATIGAFPVDSRVQKLRALLRARPGRPLMPDCYHVPALQSWVNETMQRTNFGAVFVFTVAMAPYVLGRHSNTILDAVDIDSEKWAEYATHARFPMRAVWAREGRTLLAFERLASAAARHTLFVSAPEAARFVELAPESASRVSAVENGVDLDRFAPGQDLANPFGTSPNIVFTGMMDYWPNADAVIWFAQEVMPLLRARIAKIAFWIVGANPGTDVRALKTLPGVHVTGRVEDVRPYVAHADAVVCPLRIARGIQNKVLEGMAMGRPVIASPPAFEGVRAEAGTDLLVADGALGFVAAITGVLAGHHPHLGAAARAAMERGYAWPAVLQALDRVLEQAP